MKKLGGHNRMLIQSEYHQIMKEIGYGFDGIVDLAEKAPQKVKFTAWGSWLSASAPYMHNPKECILLGYKDQWKKLEKGESYYDGSEESKREFMEYVSGLWGYFAETRGMTDANFSLDIPEKAIKFMTYKNDLVLSINYLFLVESRYLNQLFVFQANTQLYKMYYIFFLK